MKKNIKILIVDDKVENLISLEEILDEFEVDFVRAMSGNEAVTKAFQDDFALILLDIQMPEMDGFESAKLIRKEPKNYHIPIIFLSAVYSDDYYIFQGYKAGAVDYLVKPFAEETLICKVRIFLELYQQKLEIIDKQVKLEEEIVERKNTEKKLEETIVKLNDALENLQTLRGLLPICSYCKQVRDDQGYWNKIETYIQNHSDAFFSHGICPSCSEQKWGEKDWYKKLKNKESQT